MELVQLIWKISWQTAVVAAVIWAITRLAGKAPAAWRHALWLVVLIKFFVPPFVHAPAGWAFRAEEPVLTAVTASRPGSPSTYLSSFWNDALPYEKHAEQALPDIRPGSDRSAKFFSYTPSDPTVEDMVSKETGGGAHLSWIAAIWLAGVLIGSAVLVLRYVRQRRLIKCSTIAGGDAADLLDECASRLGVRRLPQMRVSEQAPTPMLVGLLRPTILLPPGIGESCSRADMTAMLMHELAHIRRWDMVGVWLYQLARVLFFFHPALWLAGHEMRREREIACDELVLSASGIRPEDYASGYVSALKMANGLARVATSLAMAEPFEVEQRRVRLMLRAVMPRFTLRWAIALAVVMLVGIPTFIGCSPSAESLAVETKVTDDGFRMEYKNPPTWKWKDLTLTVKSIGRSNRLDRLQGDGECLVLDTELRGPGPLDRWQSSDHVLHVKGGEPQERRFGVHAVAKDGTRLDQLHFDVPPGNAKYVTLSAVCRERTPHVSHGRGPYPMRELLRPLVLADDGLAMITTDWRIGGVHFSHVYEVAEGPSEYGLGALNAGMDDPPSSDAPHLNLRLYYAYTGGGRSGRPFDFVAYDTRGRAVKLNESHGPTQPLFGTRATVEVHGTQLKLGGQVIGPPDRGPYFGFQVAPLDVENDEARDGVLVVAVDPNGPAHKAGLRVGDIVLRKDKHRIRMPTDIVAGELKPERTGFFIAAGNGTELPITPVPDPIWADEGAEKAVEALGKVCERHPDAAVAVSFLYSPEPVPAGFKPVRLGFRVRVGGEVIREVRFKIRDIPVPAEFWKQVKS